MTPDQFRGELRDLGLSQVAFADHIAELAGERLPYRTVQGWALGESRIPAVVAALLALMRAQPETESRST